MENQGQVVDVGGMDNNIQRKCNASRTKNRVAFVSLNHTFSVASSFPCDDNGRWCIERSEVNDELNRIIREGIGPDIAQHLEIEGGTTRSAREPLLVEVGGRGDRPPPPHRTRGALRTRGLHHRHIVAHVAPRTGFQLEPNELLASGGECTRAAAAAAGVAAWRSFRPSHGEDTVAMRILTVPVDGAVPSDF
jgi:hypothetical protein